jgi:hypothetical protein
MTALELIEHLKFNIADGIQTCHNNLNSSTANSSVAIILTAIERAVNAVEIEIYKGNVK